MSLTAKAGITIYVQAEESPYIWAWNADEDIFSAWPGPQMTNKRIVQGMEFWYYTFADNIVTPINILFHNGAGYMTGDIFGITSDRYFIYDGMIIYTELTEEAAKPPITVSVANASRLYGDDNPEFVISYSGFIDGDNESVLSERPYASTIATKVSSVGKYPILLNGGISSKYRFIYKDGELTVNKAPLSAKVNDVTKIYGAYNPAFTIEYYGLKNDETVPAWITPPTFQTSATQTSGVGNYTVNAVNAVPVNYNLSAITPGTLYIQPASLTIKANDATRQYYSSETILSYTCSGFVNGENESVLSPQPQITTTATQSSSVGTYAIKVEGASSPNYTISFVNGTLTITPRTLFASVGNYERPYNVENPAFVVNYNGFVANDNESVLTVKPTASTTATKTSDVGTYPIIVSGGSADNYVFSYSNGMLTINKAEQTISWEQDLSGLHVDDQVELLAVASSGLPVSYMMDSSSIAELYSVGPKTYLDCKANGQVSLRAVQNGNNNYYSSPRIAKTATIGNPGTGIHSIENEELAIDSYYTLDGKTLNTPVKGVNIVKYSDGSTKKVMIK